MPPFPWTNSDQNLMSLLQLATLEPDTQGASWPSGMWSQAEIVAYMNDVQRDFLHRTGITRAISFINGVALQPRYNLPQTTIDVRRVAWREGGAGGIGGGLPSRIYVQGAVQQQLFGPTCTPVFPAANTAGNLLLALLKADAAALPVTIADTAGNTWTKLFEDDATIGPFIVYWAIARSYAGIDTVTFTVHTNGTAHLDGFCVEIGSGTVGDSNTNTGTSTTPSATVDGRTISEVMLFTSTWEQLILNVGNNSFFTWLAVASGSSGIPVSTVTGGTSKLVGAWSQVFISAFNNPPIFNQGQGTGFVELPVVDNWELDYGTDQWEGQSGSVPQRYMMDLTPPLTIQVQPPPGDIGLMEITTVDIGTALNGAGIALSVPDDWSPYIAWGVLAKMLSKEGEASDPDRAAYAESRYKEGVALGRLAVEGIT